ncbi:MAG: hypothetical protein M3N08_00755 [Pseudomonadota bacterium]|nr:hypothetical protein [Pseudomonadota bacterium]
MKSEIPIPFLTGRRLKKHAVRLAALLIMVLTLGACAAADLPNPTATTGRKPTVGEVPNADETVRGDDDPPIVTLELGSALHARPLSETEDLPGNIIVPTTNFEAAPVTTALQAVLAGTDVSLSWDAAALGDRLVTVMNLSGPLPLVVEKICSAARVFCAFRHGSLALQDRDTFIVGLPPIAKVTSASASAGGGSGNSMADTIAQIVGSKVQVDEQGGNIIYTASVDAQNRIQKYLEELRNGRPLVVLQLYIWEVTLNQQNSEGINWNAINVSDLGPGFAKLALSSASAFAGASGAAPAAAAALTSGSVSLGAITTGRLNTNSLLSFLSTQGRVQTISNPQVTFISGSGASLKVGGKQRYISQIGQLVASNNTSGTGTPPTTGVGTNTVNTDSIDTGLTVDISGAYESGVVFANLNLALTNLVSLNPTTSGGETIDLPQTTDEKISTAIRVRPGDNLVMAGLVTSKDNGTRQGIPFIDNTRIPTYGDEQLENHELVVVVRPSIVLFSDKGASLAAKKPSGQLPDAVMIDKDGSRTLAMPVAHDVPAPPLPPGAAAMPVALAPPAPVKPELMAGDADAAPTGPIPIAPSADGAPVDRRLMQRGFSHAFDELLQPGTSVTSSEEAKP